MHLSTKIFQICKARSVTIAIWVLQTYVYLICKRANKSANSIHRICHVFTPNIGYTPDTHSKLCLEFIRTLCPFYN